MGKTKGTIRTIVEERIEKDLKDLGDVGGLALWTAFCDKKEELEAANDRIEELEAEVKEVAQDRDEWVSIAAERGMERAGEQLWYSVENGGDGSAYPTFFATQKEAADHQEGHNNAGEGWAEECIGQVPVKPDGEPWEDWDEEEVE